MAVTDNLMRSEHFEQLSQQKILDSQQQDTQDKIEISVVIPCLNEAETLAITLEAARNALSIGGISGEIIVADNGSSDDSPEIARGYGALVVNVREKGYGNALMGGIAQARGKYVIMGDADASYDFGELPKFLTKLRQGYGLVQGCRMPSGGGTVMPKAMPFLHRIWGNPMFSFMAQKMFGAPIHDVNCGLRAFSKELYQNLDQRCTGMEFAVEMVLKASLRKEKIAEVPITLYPDKRVSRTPHLRTFRDGWRTLRFFLMSSPRWLFLYPGLALIILGLLGYAVALPGLHLAGIGFDVHTLLLASLSILAGYQAILFSVSAKTFTTVEGILPPDADFVNMFKVFTLERGLIAGAFSALIGATLIGIATFSWIQTGFGALDSHHTLRLVVPGVLFLMLGVQTILGSFFLSILGLKRK